MTFFIRAGGNFRTSFAINQKCVKSRIYASLAAGARSSALSR